MNNQNDEEQTVKQLKAEILPVINEAIRMLRDYKREDVIIMLSKFVDSKLT